MNTPAQTSHLATGEQGRALIMDRMVRAAESLKCLDIVEQNSNGATSPMLRLSLKKRGHRLGNEDIKADLRNVWRLGVAVSANAVYKVIDTNDGFELQFALLFETGEFATGAIRVDLGLADYALAA